MRKYFLVTTLFLSLFSLNGFAESSSSLSNVAQQALNSLQSINTDISLHLNGTEFSFKIDNSNRIGILEKFDVEFNENGARLIVGVSEQDLNDIQKTQYLNSFLRYLLSPNYITSNQLLELIYNYRNGSVAAELDLFNLEKKVLLDLSSKIPAFESLINNSLLSINEKIMKSEKKYRLDNKQRQNEWLQYKEKMNFSKLEKADIKLNDFVKNNDRVSAANLIETYLPWPLMEPMEKLYWKNWLNAMRYPDVSQGIVLFRGISKKDDPEQKKINADGSINVGYFSTILTKNQGNYNRRLRSLTTQRFQQKEKEFSSRNMFNMTRKFSFHAGNPMASYFLSTTYDIRTASAFGEDGVLLLKIDQRRLIHNIVGLNHEMEVLVPLIIFPDEVKGKFNYHEGNSRLYNNEDAKIFLQEIVKSLDKKEAQKILTEFPHKDRAWFDKVGKKYWFSNLNKIVNDQNNMCQFLFTKK
jgi:hypothetical protein